jgi:3-hydroxyacyl-CoA dehydrogenase / enoyl-CoA hydratase / 3-hydroxybutyryl-CoA epimerase / enoyl-CoA isomerase
VVGLDTMLYAGKVVNHAYADRAKDTRILAELVKAGRLGQKSGAGFYNYAKGSRGSDDPFLTTLLGKLRTAKRDVSADEITDRLFLAMLVEASRTLEEAIVRDPGDVDMGLLLGIGFPPFRGGILRWADTVGLAKILAKLEKYIPLGKRFEPTETMGRLAAANKGFFG